jgi:hypothetical protein
MAMEQIGMGGGLPFSCFIELIETLELLGRFLLQSAQMLDWFSIQQKQPRTRILVENGIDFDPL